MPNPAVCLNLTLRKLGLNRKIDSRNLKVDMDARMLKASKLLLDCPEMERIVSFDGEVRKFLERLCLPSLFKKGIYLLPYALVERVREGLRNYSLERNVLVKAFVEAYPSRVKQAMELLGGHFNVGDYPPPGAVGSYFSLTYRLMDITAPDGLKDVNVEAFEEAKRAAESAWKEALEEARSVLRSMMKELVDHMVERLGYDGTKPKVFRDSLVANMEDFLSTFSARNIASDEELQALVKKAKKAVGGVAPEMLRDDRVTRDYVRDKLGEVKAQLDTMVVERPSRTFSFEE